MDDRDRNPPATGSDEPDPLAGFTPEPPALRPARSSDAPSGPGPSSPPVRRGSTSRTPIPPPSGPGAPPSRPSRRGLEDRFAPPPASRRSSSAFYRLADLQYRHPIVILAGAALLVAVTLLLTLRLRVLPGFENLLPESRPSVIELERVKERTTGISNIMVVLEGDDTEALRKAADTIVAELPKIGQPWVGSAESGVHQTLEFLRPRAALFLPKDKLEKLRDDVEERWRYEVHRESGFLLDEEGYEPPALDAKTLKERFDVSDADTERYPGGYYQNKEGTALVVVVRSSVKSTDYEMGTEALRRVREVLDRIDVKSFHPSLRYGLTGNLVTAAAAFEAINRDLTDVGLVGALLISGVVFLYYLRFRALFAMVVTIGIGVLCAFAATDLLIGHLNLATGFLFTIIAGNGINSGIMYMARYLEARRRGVPCALAVREAHRETWLPTVTAASAAGAAYGSLVITDFRGFRDFGIIGGVGMLLCWLCTYAFLPPILVLTERISPIDRKHSGLVGRVRNATRDGIQFGRPFAAIVSRFPRVVTVTSAVVSVAGLAAMVHYLRSDPMEYDLGRIRTDMSARQEEVRLTHLSDELTGFVGIDGMAILVDRTEQVPLLVAELRKRRDAASAAEKPFEDLHTLQDFVPAEQAEKIPIVQQLANRLKRARERGFVKDEDWQKIEPLLPPSDLVPFTIAELPESLASAFSERDGTRGRIVYISPTKTESIDNAKYLFRWADSYRRTELPDGSVVLGSGASVIYADMWAAVLDDVPKAVVASLGATLLVLLIGFRGARSVWLVMGSLLVGVLWTAGLLSIANVKINFLNFIALPITFGIGVDYAVNVVQRRLREGRGGALTALRETGGAVVLCSLTTILGYLALVSSVTHSVRSLGIAAVLGETGCLLAAMLTLPAALVWYDSRPPKAAPTSLR